MRQSDDVVETGIPYLLCVHHSQLDMNQYEMIFMEKRAPNFIVFVSLVSIYVIYLPYFRS